MINSKIVEEIMGLAIEDRARTAPDVYEWFNRRSLMSAAKRLALAADSPKELIEPLSAAMRRYERRAETLAAQCWDGIPYAA